MSEMQFELVCSTVSSALDLQRRLVDASVQTPLEAMLFGGERFYRLRISAGAFRVVRIVNVLLEWMVENDGRSLQVKKQSGRHLSIEKTTSDPTAVLQRFLIDEPVGSSIGLISIACLESDLIDGPELAFELFFDPGDASDQEIAEVLAAINEFHKAAGGLGLEFIIDGTFVSAKEEVLA